MKNSLKHPQEEQRISSLRKLKILDSLPEAEFDEITLIAAQVCKTPIAMISFIDDSRQWIKSRHGIEHQDIPRDWTFCSHTILQDDLFIIPDANQDSRFKNSPLVLSSPKYKFYAGIPLFSPEGYPVGTLSVIDFKPRTLTNTQKDVLRSITKQIQRQMKLKTQVHALRETNARLEFKRTALENISEGICLHNNTGAIVDFNTSALKILGVTAEPLLESSSVSFNLKTIKENGEEFRGSHHPAMVALRTGLKQTNVIMGVYRPDSELRWLQISAVPMFLQDKLLPSHVIVSFADITDERIIKLENAKIETRVQKMLDQVPAMIGNWNKDLRNVSANIAYLDYFGKSPEEIHGKKLEELIGPELFKKNLPYIEAVLQGKIQTFEREIPTHDGQTRCTLATYLPEFENGEVVGFMVIANDITELKRAEKLGKELEAKILDSARLATVGEVAAGIAHEINNPLMIILGKVGLLKRQLASSEIDRTTGLVEFEKIESTVHRIAKIIEALILLSKDQKLGQLEAVEVSQILYQVLSLFTEKLKANSIQLKLQVEDHLILECHHAQISRALINLISNSYDSVMKLDQRWIELIVRVDGQKMVFEIIDSGKELPDAIVRKLGQPFFTTKELGKGIGLGLSVAKNIVESHNGQLDYIPKNGFTRFILTVPIKQLT